MVACSSIEVDGSIIESIQLRVRPKLLVLAISFFLREQILWIRKGMTVAVDAILVLSKVVFVVKFFTFWIAMDVWRKILRGDKTVVMQISSEKFTFSSRVVSMASPTKEEYFLTDDNPFIVLLCHVECVSHMSGENIVTQN